jgi:hypothetical protein
VRLSPENRFFFHRSSLATRRRNTAQNCHWQVTTTVNGLQITMHQIVHRCKLNMNMLQMQTLLSLTLHLSANCPARLHHALGDIASPRLSPTLTMMMNVMTISCQSGAQLRMQCGNACKKPPSADAVKRIGWSAIKHHNNGSEIEIASASAIASNRTSLAFGCQTHLTKTSKKRFFFQSLPVSNNVFFFISRCQSRSGYLYFVAELV